MQIDLLIDRADDVVNVCEIKFNKTAISITKVYADKLTERIATLEEAKPDKTFHLTLVSTAPLKTNKYSDIFTLKITTDDLFK